MDAITLGNPNLFLKGIAEQTIIDPSTGNIVGYDNIASESAISSSVNLQEITGGMGNPIVGVIPDTSRITGTYTSQAFNLNLRKLATGGNLSYNAIVPVCETLERSASARLEVTGSPVKHYAQPASDEYAWCYIRQHGSATYEGKAYQLAISGQYEGEVMDFEPVANVEYDVFYFVRNASAQVLEIPENMTPPVVTIQQKYGIYAKQNNTVSSGTFQGWLYVVVPQAILNGDAGIDGNQTSNATSNGSWMALSPDHTVMDCENCNGNGASLAYYVFVPCAGETSAVQALVVVGGAITVSATASSPIHSVQIPVRYLMPDGSTVQPKYGDLEYEVTGDLATVDTTGRVTGVTAGNDEVTITLTRSGLPTLTTYCNVTVTA